MHKVHCIGDSHVSLYNGSNKISLITENGKSSALDSISNFFTYRIGPYLAYSLSNEKHPVFKKVSEIIRNVPKDDYILLSFGEIDCRNHIIKQASIGNITLYESTKKTAESYIEGIKNLKAKQKVIVQGIHPSFNAKGRIDDLSDFSYRGSLYERNYVSRLFSEILIKESREINSFIVIDLFNKLINADGTRKEEYYLDAIHLNNKFFNLLKEDFSKLEVNVE